jgi:hypothetical protein
MYCFVSIMCCSTYCFFVCLFVCVVLYIVLCVNMYYCHQVSTQLQLHISYHIITYHIIINWKGYGSKQVGPNLRSYHICLKGLRNNKFLNLYLILEPPKNGGGLFIPLSCSAHICYMPCELTLCRSN